MAPINCWSVTLYPIKCVDGGGQCPGVDLAIGMLQQVGAIAVQNARASGRERRGMLAAVDSFAGRFNAEVRILRNLPIESKPQAETVTCFKLTTEHPERAGEVWAKRWVDAHGGAR